MPSFRALLFPGLLAVAAAGCQAPASQERAPVETHLASPQKREALPPPSSLSVEGRNLSCKVYGHGRETLLFLGGIHGSEPAGAVLCEQLCAYLEAHTEAMEGKRIVVAATLNPDGLARNQRTNAHGVDLNRNFDTRNRKAGARYGATPLSEPESRYIQDLMDRYKPSRIVSVHQPLACVDWDGEARDLAEAVSRACSLPLRKLGSRHGSLGTYAGVECGIPIITLELPTSATRQSPGEIWDQYGPGLLAVIQFSRIGESVP